MKLSVVVPGIVQVLVSSIPIPLLRHLQVLLLRSDSYNIYINILVCVLCKYICYNWDANSIMAKQGPNSKMEQI